MPCDAIRFITLISGVSQAAQVKVADVPEMDFDVWVCFVPAWLDSTRG